MQSRDQRSRVVLQEMNRGAIPFCLEALLSAPTRFAHRGYVLETGYVVKTGTGNDLLVDPAVRAAYLGG